MSELDQWNKVKKLIGSDRITLGPHYTSMLRDDPKKLLFMMSRYKFAAKIIGKNQRVLDVGCSEGIGTAILAHESKWTVGIDMDRKAIEIARENHGSDKLKFWYGGIKKGTHVFEAIVSLDVIEHIYQKNETKFFQDIHESITSDGTCVIGTPNKNAAQYASKTSKMGHVNLYAGEKLEEQMKKYFNFVTIFSMSDEIVHTGFLPMAHYLIGVGIGKKGMNE